MRKIFYKININFYTNVNSQIYVWFKYFIYIFYFTKYLILNFNNLNIQKMEKILRLKKLKLIIMIVYQSVWSCPSFSDPTLICRLLSPKNKILLPIYTICFEPYHSERGSGRYFVIGASCIHAGPVEAQRRLPWWFTTAARAAGRRFLRRRRNKKEQLSKEVHNVVRVNTTADKYQ